NSFGAFHFTSSGIGTIAESFQIHLSDHVFYPFHSFYPALRQEGQLGDLGRGEQHGTGIFTSSYTSSTAYTCGIVHSKVGILLWYRDRIGINRVSRSIYRNKPSCLLNTVKGTTIDHQILYHRKCRGPKRFYINGVPILKFPHVQLTGSGQSIRAMGLTIDLQGTGPANSFATVMIKFHGRFPLVVQLLVTDLQ